MCDTKIILRIGLKRNMQINVFGVNDNILGFLGPRGPLVLPSVGPSRPVPSVRAKNLDHLYTGIYAL